MDLLEQLVSYPLWDDDGKAALKLNKTQREAIKVFINKVNTGTYKYVKNPCLCGIDDEFTDVLIAQKDRYGIPCKNVLCMNCGLIRIKDRLDDDSTAAFYKNDYRNIYVGLDIATQDFFNSQMRRGEQFYSLISQHINISQIKTVFEVGCGAGGILNAFKQAGHLVSGCDFGEKYLAFGRLNGLTLYQGELSTQNTAEQSQDLIILSHVMEHFNTPIESLINITKFIKPEGYLFIEVPGIFNIPKAYENPLMYFQNAHVYNFHANFLKTLFKSMGLEVILSNETCSLLLKKPKDWSVPNIGRFLKASHSSCAEKVAISLKKYYLQHMLKINPTVYRKLFSFLLRKTGIKDIISTKK